MSEKKVYETIIRAYTCSTEHIYIRMKSSSLYQI